MKLKLTFIILFFFLGSLVQAKSYELQLYPFGLLSRYQDTVDQQRNFMQYAHYAVQLVYEDWVTGLEYNKSMPSKTGNASLNVDTTQQEFNLIAGYRVYSYQMNLGFNIKPDFNLNAIGLLGGANTTVETTLLGQRDKEVSKTNFIIGAGLQTSLRVSYFICALEGRLVSSREYSPSLTFVGLSKLGVAFSF